MKEKSELNDLFRSRLSGAKMTVRDGSWEKLHESMCQYAHVPMKSTRIGALVHYRIGTIRVAAAAAVVLLLGIASAAFWYFSPEAEIKEAFTQMATLTPEVNLNNDALSTVGADQAKQNSLDTGLATDDTDRKLKPRHSRQNHQEATGKVTGRHCGLPLQEDPSAETDEDDETLSVHVSITITERVQGGGGYTANGGYQPASETHRRQSAETGHSLPASQPKPRNWALKAGVGTSLPKGDCDAPFTAAVGVERRLGKRFSVEAGLRYNCLGGGGQTLHTLEVPLRVNMLLASSKKVDLYALAGGSAEKCVAGAEDNGFGAEPVQLAVAAGLGLRYRLNDRLSLFAEPTVSHHFDTDSQTQSLRTLRATNFNLLCGVRMTY